MALTSMLGVDDVAGETFTLGDGARVRRFAARERIAWVSLWATFRDRPCEDGESESGQGDAATDRSGVEQDAGAFVKVFAG